MRVALAVACWLALLMAFCAWRRALTHARERRVLLFLRARCSAYHLGEEIADNSGVPRRVISTILGRLEERNQVVHRWEEAHEDNYFGAFSCPEYKAVMEEEEAKS